MTDLAELLERVRKATGPDRALDKDIARALDLWGAPDEHSHSTLWVRGFTASLDAALALVERVLGRDRAETLAQAAFGSTRYVHPLSSAFALALLAALLSALIAQPASDDVGSAYPNHES